MESWGRREDSSEAEISHFHFFVVVVVVVVVIVIRWEEKGEDGEKVFVEFRFLGLLLCLDVEKQRLIKPTLEKHHP